MAKPRVFISSTCYDLAPERDSLLDFCESFGFESALSERGDVFFHPDLHTHDSCIHEIRNCHILILIVGGRFGGNYRADKTRSITNAEFVAAKNAGIPVFAFIKRDVLQDHNTWQSNRDKSFVEEIHYPSIERQEHAVAIFSFIDEIRKAKINNSYFPFHLPKDIHETLRKQWAAMFLEFIQQRSLSQQIIFTNENIGKLAEATKKIEEITHSLLKNSDTINAQPTIDEIQRKAISRRLFTLIAAQISDDQFIFESDISKEADKPSPTWWEMLSKCGFFDVESFTDELGDEIRALVPSEGAKPIPFEGALTKREKSNLSEYEESYSEFLKLGRDSRAEIMSEFCFVPRK